MWSVVNLPNFLQKCSRKLKLHRKSKFCTPRNICFPTLNRKLHISFVRSIKMSSRLISLLCFQYVSCFFYVSCSSFPSLWYFARFPGFKNKLLRESDYDILRKALRLTRKWLDLCSHQPPFNFSSLHFHFYWGGKCENKNTHLSTIRADELPRICIQQEIDNRRWRDRREPSR